jgi:hypothetical protein
LHLCDRVNAASPGSAPPLRRLLADYARSVPGAVEYRWQSEESVYLMRVWNAVTAELNLIRVEDESGRKREAERAMRSLDEGPAGLGRRGALSRPGQIRVKGSRFMSA